MKNISVKSNRDMAGIRLVQLEVEPGRPAINTKRILDAIAAAKRDAVELIVFPELAVSGASLGLRWKSESFLRECETCGERIRDASSGITVVFGNAAADWSRRNNDGTVRKYNAVFVAEDGCFKEPVNGIYPFVLKNLMPGRRTCESDNAFHDIAGLALELGCTVERLISPVYAGKHLLGCMCCDGMSGERVSETLEILCRHPVNLLVVIGCVPYTADAERDMRDMLESCAKEKAKPIVFVNNIGIRNAGKVVQICEGRSCVFDVSGKMVARLDGFRSNVVSLNLPLSAPSEVEPVVCGEKNYIHEICDSLLYGIGEFTRQIGCSKVLVGISGGIDSAVVAALYARILPPENLFLVCMPGRFVSPGGLALARELAENIGCLYAELGINESVELTAAQVAGLEISAADGSLKRRLELTDFMLENIQARDRSSRLLAALAAAFEGVFTCNANKSELTAGYSTLYGDLAGYLAPIADLWKGQVYEVARHINGSLFEREVIPRGCFERVPSAELNSRQNADAGQGDPFVYSYHDCLFRSWTEWKEPAGPEDILEWYSRGELEQRIGYAGNLDEVFSDAHAFIEDMETWWSRCRGIGAAKRIQSPPILSVKERSFGECCGEQQLGDWFGERYKTLKNRIME